MSEDKIYRILRKHLDTLPVGYPRTLTGVEIRLLKQMFTPEQAQLALGLSYRFRSPDEILTALHTMKIHAFDDTLHADLRTMASNGTVLYREQENSFSLMPFIVGLFELQINRLSKNLVRDTVSYMKQGFGLEFISTPVRQTRIIPVQESIVSPHRVASYDEVFSLIENSGDPIAVAPCICRAAADISGNPCIVTQRRDLCMAFRDYARTYIREGWGRVITKNEAFEIARKNMADGLVMQPSGEKEPQFLCACCGDCCGILAIIKSLPRPADFVASNYSAEIDKEKCTGCSLCVKKCQMNAIHVQDRKAIIRDGACIGCGVCVPRCPKAAIRMNQKDCEFVPPDTTESMLDAIAASRQGSLKKLSIGLRGVLGWKEPLSIVNKIPRPIDGSLSDKNK
jgi:Na+-translocating ferredoxin:NAD+ oxidoreductase RNF subunit RnfB